MKPRSISDIRQPPIPAGTIAPASVSATVVFSRSICSMVLQAMPSRPP